MNNKPKNIYRLIVRSREQHCCKRSRYHRGRLALNFQKGIRLAVMLFFSYFLPESIQRGIMNVENKECGGKDHHNSPFLNSAHIPARERNGTKDNSTDKIDGKKNFLP